MSTEMIFNSREELEAFAFLHEAVRLDIYLDDPKLQYPIDIPVDPIHFTYGWDLNPDLWKQALHVKRIQDSIRGVKPGHG